MLYSHGVTVQGLKDWLHGFAWPHGLRTHRNQTLRIFDKRISPGDFKCSASQGLNLYPLLRLFLPSLRGIPGLLAKAISSCLNLFLVLDLLLRGNRGEQVPPDDLEAAILKHCRGFIDAHGSEATVPKFHYSLHVAGFARKKPLSSCFTHERKHRQIEQLANEIHNPGDWFEKSVFRDGARCSCRCKRTLSVCSPICCHPSRLRSLCRPCCMQTSAIEQAVRLSLFSPLAGRARAANEVISCSFLLVMWSTCGCTAACMTGKCALCVAF